MDFLWGFQPDKLKSNLKMATLRINIIKNKKYSQVQVKKREVAKLLQAGKLEKARIQTESIIREDFTMEAMEIVSLMCDLLLERTKYLASEKDCPPDLQETVSTVIWTANRIEVTELLEVKKQLTRKYGSATIQQFESNPENAKVNLRVIEKLSVQPPSNKLVNKYMKEIAEKNNLEWSPIELDDLTDGPTPTPSGFSVGMSPLAELSGAYERMPNSASEPPVPDPCPAPPPPIVHYSLPLPSPTPSCHTSPPLPSHPYYPPQNNNNNNGNHHHQYQPPPPPQYLNNPQYSVPPTNYMPPFDPTHPHQYQSQPPNLYPMPPSSFMPPYDPHHHYQQPPSTLYYNDPMHYPHPPASATAAAFPYLEPEPNGYINEKNGSISYADNTVTYAEASVIPPAVSYLSENNSIPITSVDIVDDPPPPYPHHPEDIDLPSLPELPSPPLSLLSTLPDHNNNSSNNNTEDATDDTSLDELTARFSKLKK